MKVVAALLVCATAPALTSREIEVSPKPPEGWPSRSLRGVEPLTPIEVRSLISELWLVMVAAAGWVLATVLLFIVFQP